MKWTKLHRDEWFSPLLRICPFYVRILYADLSCLCADDGFIASSEEELSRATGLTPEEVSKGLKELRRLGFLDVADGCYQMRAVARDTRYRRSRVKGGKARQRAANATHAQHDAQHQCSASSSLLFSESDSGSGVSEVRSLKPEKKRSGKVREVVDFAKVELPPEIDTPEARRILVEAAAVRAENRHDPIGPHGWKMRLRNLAEWGPQRFLAAVIHSASYEGLFEPRASGSPQAARPDGLAALRQRLNGSARTVTAEPLGGKP